MIVRPVAAVVLAAGLSSRMAPHNKLLLADPQGLPMVARVIAACCASLAEHIVMVTGHQAALVEQAVLASRPTREIRIVRSAGYASGLSASLRTGIDAVPVRAGAALICLGDMPLVTADMIDRIIAAYDPDTGRAIVVPTCHGRFGNPVLWDRRFFAEIGALSGDAGARALLDRHADQLCKVEIGGSAILLDFDTPASLTAG